MAYPHIKFSLLSQITMQAFYQGVFWKILSCLCFSFFNVFSKYAQGLAMEKTILLDYFSTSLFLIVFQFIFKKNIKKKTYLFLLKTPLFWMSSALALLGAFFWQHSLMRIGIFQSVTLSFLSPIITIIGATLFLQETLTLRKIISIVFALMGSMLISHGHLLYAPQLTSNDSSFPVETFLSILCFCCVNIINKRLLIHVDALALTVFSQLVCTMGILFSIMGWHLIPLLYVPMAHHLPDLNPISWGICFLCGFLKALAYLSLNQSLQVAELTALIPIGSIKFILSGLMGYFFFHEIFPMVSVFGTLFIFSALYLLKHIPKKSFFSPRNQL